MLKAGETATAEEIIAFCRERAGGVQGAAHVEFRESCPRALIGKHLRRVLMEEERAKLAAPVAVP